MSNTLSAPEPLNDSHILDAFSCGIPELDSWLQDRALRNLRNDTSRTFVISRDQRVVGYFALAAGAVARVDAPKSLGRNSPDPIPVFLLGRLAIARSEQGSDLGGFLLRDALTRCLSAASSIGAKAVMVNAISDDAIRFYQRYEFRPSPVDPFMLFLPMRFIREQFESALNEM